MRRGSAWHPLTAVVPRPGTAWQGSVQGFKGHPVTGTLLARWEEGSGHPWRLLTDLPPQTSEVIWYRLRGGSSRGSKISNEEAGRGTTPR